MSKEAGGRRPASDAAPTARVAALVLAAGASSRMGEANKLLAPVEGRAMVARVVDAALHSRAEAVLVVTGHDASGVRQALRGLAVEVVHNPRHRSGLAGSLRAGIDALGARFDGVLVCLADMPWVQAAHLDALIGAFAARADRPICAPEHAGRRGNPVLWPARHFAALCRLEGDVGGRALLAERGEEVLVVEVADDAVLRDVDRPGDLRLGRA